MNILMLAYWLIGFVIFALDRITKYGALMCLSDRSYEVTSFLSFELVMNRGISWGIFHSESSSAFVIVSLIIVIVTMIIGWHAYYMIKQNISIFGHICIIAGSLSNVIDRIYYSGVIDFILFSYNTMHWPVFNCADVAIVSGVIIMLLHNEA